MPMTHYMYVCRSVVVPRWKRRRRPPERRTERAPRRLPGKSTPWFYWVGTSWLGGAGSNGLQYQEELRARVREGDLQIDVLQVVCVGVALSVARLRVGRHVLCDFLTIRQTEVHAGVRDE